VREIPARYRKRLAVVYIRQSTERQVRFNEGSRRHQESQLDHALRCGWQREDIVVIDCDLAYSGLDLKRRGYRQMVDMIESDAVGAVFISEVSRAGRNDQAWLHFLALLGTHDVLLFEDGVPTDPNDDDQVFVKKIQALTVFRENKMRTVNLHRGRLAKARSGKAVSAPPAGYVPLVETRDGLPVKTGKWAKDPDPAVREAVDAVFRAFREARSLPKATKLLIKWKVLLPVRRGD
jgi:DNA invertase Pin-like site-specific DNA recombinase